MNDGIAAAAHLGVTWPTSIFGQAGHTLITGEDETAMASIRAKIADEICSQPPAVGTAILDGDGEWWRILGEAARRRGVENRVSFCAADEFSQTSAGCVARGGAIIVVSSRLKATPQRSGGDLCSVRRILAKTALDDSRQARFLVVVEDDQLRLDLRDKPGSDLAFVSAAYPDRARMFLFAPSIEQLYEAAGSGGRETIERFLRAFPNQIHFEQELAPIGLRHLDLSGAHPQLSLAFATAPQGVGLVCDLPRREFSLAQFCGEQKEAAGA